MHRHMCTQHTPLLASFSFCETAYIYTYIYIHTYYTYDDDDTNKVILDSHIYLNHPDEMILLAFVSSKIVGNSRCVP